MCNTISPFLVSRYTDFVTFIDTFRTKASTVDSLGEEEERVNSKLPILAHEDPG